MGKVLHLIPDEKITSDVINNFDRVSQDNMYFILGDKNNRKYLFKDEENIIWGNENYINNYKVSSDVTGVIIHGLNYSFAKFILSLSKRIKIAWYAWGFDIYLLPKISKHIYGKHTRRFLIEHETFYTINQLIKNNPFLRSLYFKFIKKKDDHYKLYELAHSRIDYLCTYIKEDFDVFQKFYPNKNIKFLNTGYFSIGQYLGKSEDELNTDELSDLGNNILIGNSNSVENNHLDVFYALDSYKRNNSNLIVPLNYGTNENYKNFILSKGEECFNNDFHPLLSFMNKGEYFTLLSTCNTGIFYHFRQQAMGNIIALLFLGLRIYLSNKNPVYSYLKRNNITVFDFDTEFEKFGNAQLSKDIVKNNRLRLMEMFNNDLIIRESKEVIKTLTNES